MQALVRGVSPPIDDLLHLDDDYGPVFDATPPGLRERHSKVPVGLKGLMLAVLEEGVSCYLTSKGRIRQDAEDWVHSNTRRQPFDFTVICETLDLQPAAVREALRRMRERGNVSRRAIARSRPNARRAHRLELPRKSRRKKVLATL